MSERRLVQAAVTMGALSASLSRGPSLLPRTAGDQAIISAGSALMGAAAGALAHETAVQVARRLGRSRAMATALLAVPAGAAWLWAARRDQRPTLVAALETAGCVTAVAASGAEAGASLYDRLPAEARRSLRARAVGLTIAAAGAIAALRRQIAEPRDLQKSAIDYDYLPTVSGGEGSLAPRHALDREGRKFLALAAPAAAIEEVMGSPARDPIRVYVGLESAATPEARVELALVELDRLSAFSRRLVLVACPTGSGLVNPVFVEALEYLSRGDVATVAVQNSSQRSMRSLRSIPNARDTYRLLLQALADRLRESPDRPEVAFYGESLGAWIGAEILAQDGGLDLMQRLGVDRAVLLGIPFQGARKLMRLRRSTGRLPDAIGVFTTAAELDALPAEERRRLRYAIVTHPEDPVANYTSWQLLWRRPFWLRSGRKRDPRVPAGMRWMPGITFLQVAFDVKNGTMFQLEFEPRHHDYRAEHPGIVRAVFGFDHVTDPQLQAVGERTVASAAAQKARELAART
jgi:uncharacterized membrane protein